MKKRPHRSPAHKLDPILPLKGQIMNLLDDMSRDYAELSQSGTPLAHRLALARYSAEAKGILQVIQAGEAYPIKEDIL